METILKFYCNIIYFWNFKIIQVSIESESQKPPEIKHLVVSVLSKTVRLPENEATLSAYTVPADDTGMELVISKFIVLKCA